MKCVCTERTSYERLGDGVFDYAEISEINKDNSNEKEVSEPLCRNNEAAPPEHALFRLQYCIQGGIKSKKEGTMAKDYTCSVWELFVM